MGSKLATHLLKTSSHFLATLRSLIQRHNIPPHLLCFPPHLATPPPDETRAALSPVFSHLSTPIIPVLTSRPRPLSAYLRTKGMNARPITWPTVPKGRDRIRVCLHSGNSREEVENLAFSMVEWAREQMSLEISTGGVETSVQPRLSLQSKL